MRIPLLTLLMGLVLLATPASADVGIYFRPVDEQPGARSPLYPVRGTTELVRLAPEVIVDARDVASVSAMQDDANGAAGLSFRFTPRGAERMRAWSSRNVGHRLALLVDGEVLATPRIMEAVSDTVVMTGRYTLEQARRMAAQMTAARSQPRVGLIVTRDPRSVAQESIAQVAWQRLVLKRALAGYLRSRLPIALYDVSRPADRAACAKLGITSRDQPCLAVVRLEDGRPAGVLQRWNAVTNGAAASDEAFHRAEEEGILPED